MSNKKLYACHNAAGDCWQSDAGEVLTVHLCPYTESWSRDHLACPCTCLLVGALLPESEQRLHLVFTKGS